LSNHCQGLRCTFSQICTKFDEVHLSGPSQNQIRPGTQLQMNGHTRSAHPPSCMKLCTLTPKIC
jgi:hypothetical protein